MPLIHGRNVEQAPGFPSLPQDWMVAGDSFFATDGHTPLFATVMNRTPKALKARGDKAVVVGLFVVHGMGEHGARYLHLPHYLNDTVDAVYCLDHMGHGRSGGQRGHVENFDDLVHDLAQAMDRFQKHLATLGARQEIHLLGHSLGGHLALRLMLLYPHLAFASANVSAPFLAVHPSVPKFKQKAALGLSLLIKRMPIDTGLDATGLSHDPNVVEHYVKDPLNHGKMTPGFFRSMNQAFSDTLARTQGFKVPVQFLIPLQDRIVDESVGLHYFENLQSTEKNLQKYDAFFHESMNEIGKEQPLADIRQWIRLHSVTAEAAGV